MNFQPYSVCVCLSVCLCVCACIFNPCSHILSKLHLGVCMHRLERLLAHTTLRSDLGDSEWTSWLCVKAYGCVPILFTLLLALKGCLWKLHVCRPVHKDVVLGRLFHKFSHVCHQCLLGPYRLYVKHVHVCQSCSIGCLPLQVTCEMCACVPSLFIWMFALAGCMWNVCMCANIVD